MKAPKQLLTLALVASAAACAALMVERPPEEDAELRLDRGLFALDAGRYSDAFDDLAWVYSRCAGHQAGSRALIALAALELDGRNPRARPGVGTELLGRVIRDPATARWLRPLAETTFLTSLALGAPRPSDREPEPGARDDAPDDPPDRDTAAAPDTTGGAVEEPDQEALRARVLPAAVPAPDGAPARVHGCGRAVAAEIETPPALPELPGPSMAVLLMRSEAGRDSLALRADTLQAELAAVREQLQATEDELERIRKTLKP